MRNRPSGVTALLLGLALVLLWPSGPALAQECAGPTADSPEGVVIAGLTGPQGVLVAPDGTVWVVDSGIGGENEMEAMGTEGEPVTATYGESSLVCKLDADGTVTHVATLPSMLLGQESVGGARLALVDGELYVTSGGWIDDGADPPNVLPNTAAVLKVGSDGSLEPVAELWTVENLTNPDGAIKESHPYGVIGTPDGMLLVADAGGNALYRIDPDEGTIELVTVFEPLPGVFPSPSRGGEMLADPVPTGLVQDDDGNTLVSLLSGAPFVPGSAKIVMVAPNGERSDYATGLTMLTDLRRGPDGNLYAVQFALFTDQGPTPNSGAIVRVLPGEESVPVVTELPFPTSIGFNEAGDAFVSVNGVGAPGSGAVVMLPGVAAGEAAMDAATEEVTPEATEEAMEEAMTEATPEATEEAMEEAMAEATPEATEEAMEEAMAEATPEPTEEAMEEAMAEATPEPTEEAMEEAMGEATPEPTEEMMEEAMSPETMPATGSGQPTGTVVFLVIAGLLALLAGNLVLRRRQI